MVIFNGIKSNQQMRTKLKHLKEDHYNTTRNNDKGGRGRKIALYMEELNLLFSCRPKNQTNFCGGSVIDPDEVRCEHYDTMIMENNIVKKMENNDITMMEEV